MIGRTNTGGGSGGGLNFKVVGGTTQPSNPKENTIWINTDIDIPGWIFAPENPFLKEIYTEVGITADNYINNSGDIISSTNYTLTGMIPLPDGTVSVTITADSNVSTTVSHWFYDVNKNAISYVLRQNGTANHSVPSGAKFVRASIRTGDTKSIIANVNADNGTVWIETGITTPVEFNALKKKNGIMVYPLSAKQYVSGVFAHVNSMSWQEGKWVEWIPPTLVLYDKGNECTSVTGGWVAGANVSVTKNADDIRIKANDNTKYTYVFTKNAIDLSAYTVLHAIARIGTGATAADLGSLGISANGSSSLANIKFKNTEYNEVTFDVGTYSGLYKIHVGDIGNTSSAFVQKVWLT